MNRTAITLGFFVLGAIGLVGGIVVLIIKPEASAEIVTLITTVGGLATSGAVTFHMLNKQDAKLEVVKTQTNGNLTRAEKRADEAEARAATLQAELDKLGR